MESMDVSLVKPKLFSKEGKPEITSVKLPPQQHCCQTGAMPADMGTSLAA